jgi:hypothetical protein
MPTIRILPLGKMLTVERGSLLRDVQQSARIMLDYPCGGKGRCGQCRFRKQGSIGTAMSSGVTSCKASLKWRSSRGPLRRGLAETISGPEDHCSRKGAIPSSSTNVQGGLLSYAGSEVYTPMIWVPTVGFIRGRKSLIHPATR